MFANTIALTYNAVSKTLTRTTQSKNSSVYYLNDGLNRYTLTLDHSIPSSGKAGESHVAKLTTDVYDANGVLIRSVTCWDVMKTFLGVQDDLTVEYTQAALTGFLSAGNVTKLVDREN